MMCNRGGVGILVFVEMLKVSPLSETLASGLSGSPNTGPVSTLTHSPGLWEVLFPLGPLQAQDGKAEIPSVAGLGDSSNPCRVLPPCPHLRKLSLHLRWMLLWAW